MKNKICLFLKRLVVYATLSCMVSQTAQAGLTDISNVPLATAGGSTVLPNLLFTLDDSLSMTWDFMPDYVNPNQSFVSLAQSKPCMTDSGGRTYCLRGDPPYEAGGSAGFNGVGYDPNFYYHAGVNSNGQAVLNPLISVSPATVTATTLTAHGLTTTDKIYVTSSANSALNVTCVAINTTTATTFTYTAASSGTITATGGTYRRCTDGSFTRASSTVTVTKAGHGLVNNDVITTF